MMGAQLMGPARGNLPYIRKEAESIKNVKAGIVFLGLALATRFGCRLAPFRSTPHRVSGANAFRVLNAGTGEPSLDVGLRYPGYLSDFSKGSCSDVSCAPPDLVDMVSTAPISPKCAYTLNGNDAVKRLHNLAPGNFLLASRTPAALQNLRHSVKTSMGGTP